jgi:hypothetical protein
MLLRAPHSTSGPNGQVVTYLAGPVLCRMLRGKSPQARARLVARLLKLGVTFQNLSAAQLARLCEANPGAVSAALGNVGSRGPRDRTIDHLVKKYGADAIMRAVDRATAPQRIAAE